MDDLLHLEEVLKENRVLVTKPHNKTPYELLIGRSPNLDFMKPLGCPVTILNTLDHLGKFEGKADEGFLVGYSVNRRGPEGIFDIDSLTNSMNYEPVTAGNQTNNGAGIEINANVRKAGQEKASDHEYILLPFMPSSTQSSNDKDAGEVPDKGDEEETGIFDDVYNDREVGAEADTNNLELLTVVSPIPTTRVQKDHPKEQIIRDLNLSTQTRRMLNFSKENAMISSINKQRRTNHKDYQNCLFACFLSQQEPKKVIQALADPRWIEAMQEELLQFKLQKDRSNQDLFSLCIIYGIHCVPDGCKEYLSVLHNRRGAKANAASEYGYYCLKLMFEEKLQLLVKANINAD
uniref:Putative ribonuclease H-like domain-containing protein n=1 Tax=Tanacetum cinerariifolium TaxID=118510 RepID=A0A6L2P2Y7_TANCI|nr:putative ribonuclease H-like domain-containing protein [Tanacetum cinerariifolium]